MQADRFYNTRKENKTIKLSIHPRIIKFIAMNM